MASGVAPLENSAPAEDPTAAPAGEGRSDTHTAAILTAVEQQLTVFAGAIVNRVDEVQKASQQQIEVLTTALQQFAAATRDEQVAAEASRDEIVAYFQQQVDVLKSELDQTREENEGYQQALQAAIEARLTEFVTSQNWRFGVVEGRLDRVTEDVSLSVPLQIEAATSPLQDRMDSTTELLANRIEELQNAARQFDERSADLVQLVTQSTGALTDRFDDSSRVFTGQLDERTSALSQRVDEAMTGMRQHVTDQAGVFNRKIEDTENKIIDRALAMEERINENTGVRLAGVEATIGRISSGIDEAIVAVSHRVIQMEAANLAIDARLDEMAKEIAAVDQETIDQLREQMSSAVGESMLVRIELERVANSTTEQFDKINVHIAELASSIEESNLDVSTAVQLERLEEIERALVELNPDQFVRKTDSSADPSKANAGENPTESNLSSR